MQHVRPDPSVSYIAERDNYPAAAAALNAILFAWAAAQRQAFASFAAPAWNLSQLRACDWCGCATDVVMAAGTWCSERCEALVKEAAAIGASEMPAPLQTLLQCADHAGLGLDAQSEIYRIARVLAAEHRLAATKPGLLDGVRAMLTVPLGGEGARTWLVVGRAEWQGRSALEMLELPTGAEEVISQVGSLLDACD
jgi:hypothetical protein